MSGQYYTWECNGMYPQAILTTLQGELPHETSGIVMQNLKCRLVSSQYVPLSSHVVWTDVSASLPDSSHFSPAFDQATLGCVFDYTSSIEVNTMMNYDDAARWGLGKVTSDANSVFPGASLPMLSGSALGLDYQYIIFYTTYNDLDQLYGTIQKDNGGSTLAIVPNGTNITVQWQDPWNGTSAVPGILFRFDVCDCEIHAPDGP